MLIILLITTPEKPISVGKYLVSPLTQLHESGRYTAFVSIRNGAHDRVFRFTPQFLSKEAASEYALAEGHRWIRQRYV